MPPTRTACSGVAPITAETCRPARSGSGARHGKGPSRVSILPHLVAGRNRGLARGCRSHLLRLSLTTPGKPIPVSVVIDDELMAEALERTGLKTKNTAASTATVANGSQWGAGLYGQYRAYSEVTEPVFVATQCLFYSADKVRHVHSRDAFPLFRRSILLGRLHCAIISQPGDWRAGT